MTAVRISISLLLAIFIALPAANAKICVPDRVPAATVLVPYMEVSLDLCDQAIERPSILLTNHGAAQSWANITIWSNAGVPVLSQAFLIPGNGTRDLAIGELICSGSESDLGLNLTSDELAHVQAYLSGAQSPTQGNCASISSDTDVAQMYITVDQIQNDTDLTPADAGYYSGTVLGESNILSARYELIDPVNNFSETLPAVAIEASGSYFGDGSRTFYGRYNSADGSDGREPLPTTWAAPFQLDDGSLNEVLVWREANASAAPFACSDSPGWFPLQHAGNANPLVSVDDDGASDFVTPKDALPLATQRLAMAQSPGPPNIPVSSDAGWLRMNLQHAKTVYGTAPHGQAWVITLRSQAGRFQTGQDALALDRSCQAFSLLAVPVTGRAQ